MNHGRRAFLFYCSAAALLAPARVDAFTGFRAMMMNRSEPPDQPPVWVTASGSLGSWNEGAAVNTSVTATDPEGGGLTYAVVAGALPGGLSLTPSTGVISGTAAAVTADTTSNFTIRATDTSGQTVDRAFSITVTDVAPVYTSLLFNGAQNLTRVLGAPTNGRKFTFRVKFMRSVTGVRVPLIGTPNTSNTSYIRINSDGRMEISQRGASLTTSMTFSSTSTIYDLVVAFDCTNTTNSMRCRVWVNGAEITTFSGDSRAFFNNGDSHLNVSGGTVYIGRDHAGGSAVYFRGYMSQPIFIDGDAVGPSYFSDPVNIANYGNNGFRLGGPNNGWNPANLGADYSGRGNHFTPSGFGAGDVGTVI